MTDIVFRGTAYQIGRRRSDAHLRTLLQAMIDDDGATAAGSSTDARLDALEAIPLPATTASMTLYVDGATGSDSNPGTALLPYATIQAAINRVPKIVKHAVDINVAAGNYAGFSLSGFIVLPAVDGTASYIAVTGTFTTTTGLASGTATGTLTGYSGPSGQVAHVFTDSTQNWAVNALRGKWIWISGGTGSGSAAIYPIVSNTATAITGTQEFITAPAAGSTYAILDPATNIITPIPAEAVNATGASNYAVGQSVRVVNSFGAGFVGSAVIIQKLNFAHTSLARAIALEGGSLTVQWCKTSSNVQLGIAVTHSGRLYATHNHFFSGTLGHISAADTAFDSGGLRVVANYFDAGPTGINTSALACSISQNTFRAQTTASIRSAQGASGAVQTSGNRIDGSAVGILCAPTNQGWQPFAIGISFADISNCTTAAISLECPISMASVGGSSGTGNAIGIKITKGANIQVASNVTLTGTVEVQVDGTNTDLGTMRALNPKAYPAVASPFGTRFYE